MQTYTSIEVLDFRANFQRIVNGELSDFSYQAEGFGPGTPWKITSRLKRRIQMPMLLDGRSEMWEMRKFFDRTRGQQRSFWVPAYFAEYDLIGTYAAGSTTLDIKGINLASKWNIGQQFRHLCVLSFTKMEFYGMTSVLGSSTETILLSRPLDTALDNRTIICPALLMRLATDSLDYNYLSDECAVATLDLIEVPAETPNEDGTVVVNTGTRPIFLYEFTINGVVTRYCNYGVNVSANAVTWTAENISDDGVEAALEVIGSPITIRIRTGNNSHLAIKWIDRLNMQNADVKIYESDADSLSFDAAAPVYSGRIEKVNYETEGLVLLECSSIFRFAEKRVPAIQIQRTCNHRTYDANCGLVEATFTTTGTISAISASPAYVEATAFGTKVTATGDANWFALGKVTVGTEVRLCTGTNGANRLYLNFPFKNAIVGNTVAATAGDNKRVGTCNSKFNNLPNFLGWPYVPSRNPQFKALETPKTTSGKKG